MISLGALGRDEPDAGCCTPRRGAAITRDEDLEAERQRPLAGTQPGNLGTAGQPRGARRSGANGVLGELEQLEAELRLRRKERQGAGLRLEDVTADIARHDVTLARLDEAQAQRRRYLAFKLREIYKAGSEQTVHRFLGGRGPGAGMERSRLRFLFE